MSNSQKLSQVVAGGNDVVLDILAATANPNEYLKVGSSGTALTFEPSSALVVSLGLPLGATETTTSANITLTNSANQIQYVTTTVPYRGVTLPDATTLTTGGGKYVIENNGSYTIVIRDSSGILIGSCATGYNATCDLVNNSTAAGIWAIRIAANSTLPSPYANTPVASNAYATSVNTQSRLSCFPGTSYAICAATNGIFLATISNGTATFGATNTLGTTAAYVAVLAVDATTAVVSYRDSTDSNKWKAVHATINGTGFTLGTPITLSTTDHAGTCISQISASAVLLTARNQSNTRPQAVAISISGTTLTAGSVLELSTSTVNDIQSIASAVINGTNALCVWSASDTSTRPKGARISISGTTLAVLITDVLLDAGGSQQICVASVNTARSMFSWINTSNAGNITTLDTTGSSGLAVAGAAVTFGTAATVRSNDVVLPQYSSTALYVVWANNDYGTYGRTIQLTAATSTAVAVGTILNIHGGTGLTALTEYAGADFVNSATLFLNGQEFALSAAGATVIEGSLTR